MYARFLNRYSFRVETAGTGPDLIDLLQRVRPVVVLAEPVLPGVAGDELAVALATHRERFGAAILVILFQPLHDRISKFVKSSAISAIFSTLLVVVLIILPLLLVGGLITRELRHFYNEARLEAQSQAQSQDQQTDTNTDTGFSWLIESVSQQISRVSHVEREKVREFFAGHIRQVDEYLLGHTTGFLRNASVTLFHIILALFTMFFLFKDKDKIVETGGDLNTTCDNCHARYSRE